MEYLIVGILKIPDTVTIQEAAKLEAKLVERMSLDALGIYSTERKPLVYWAFHPLNMPFPIDWPKGD